MLAISSRALSDDHKYPPEEVALVLRRLAELSVHEPESALTRAELEQVATESGLDVRHLDTALAEVELMGKRQAKRVGLRLFVVVHRSVIAELSRAKLEAAAALLDRSIGIVGERSFGEASLTWFGRHVAVSIQREGERVTIRLEERFHRTVESRLGLSLFSAVPAGALMLAAGPAAPLLALVPIGLYAAFRRGHRRRVETTEQQLEQIANQLAGILAP